MVNALICSGLSTNEFSFYGFLPLNKKLRKQKLEEIKNENKTIILYDAPHKMKQTLKDLKEILENRKVVLASSTQMKIFKKTKSQIKTIILFVTKQINLTPNTIFKQKTLKFLRSYKFHKRNKSGIEIFLEF